MELAKKCLAMPDSEENSSGIPLMIYKIIY